MGDLIVTYDAAKHRQEAEEFMNGGRSLDVQKVRGMLDGQMLEIKAIRDKEAADKRQEAEDMRKRVEENKRLDQEEHDVLAAKMDKMAKHNEEIQAHEENRKQKK